MDVEQILENICENTRKQLPEFTAHLSWSKQQIKEHQLKKLKQLFTHVLQHSPHYQERLKDIDLNKLTLSDLQKIEPTNKKELMQNWDAICCAKNITKAIAEQHTSDYREGKIDNPFHQQNYYFVSTGGSSGLRGLFIWDLNYLPILSCATHRYRWKDQKSTVTSPARIAIITAPSFLHGSKTLFSVSFEEDLCQLRLSSETAVSEICEALNNFQPTHIIGFTSVIGELATQALRGQLAIQPVYISPNSEPLDDETRDNIRKAWSIEVHNMWGSVEMGISGVEDDEHIGLKLSEDLCIYETVDENLNPTDDPEQVKKLLVTNLYNYSLPLIRYVVDDTLEIKKSDDCAYRLVTAIKGRADDWFNYGDIRIHPMTFRHVFGQDQNIIEYQVKQTVKGADIFLICDGQANTDKLNEALTEALIKAGLASPQININIVKKLERHAETGKLKRFVPLK